MRAISLAGAVLVWAGLFFLSPAPVRAAEPLVAVQVKRVLLVNGAPAVLLVDAPGTQFLLVFIDYFMASAIQMGMEQPRLERPLTHDLIGIFLHLLGAQVTRIEITELKNNTYYALITLQVNGSTQQVDARPSDALALAVRHKAPVFVNPALLQLVRDSLANPPPGEPQPPAVEPKSRAST